MSSLKNGEFAGKVAYVSGAGNGIGRATAIAFSNAGADVAVVDIDETAAGDTARLIRESGGRALEIQADLTDGAEAESSLARTVGEFGTLDTRSRSWKRMGADRS